MAASKDILVTEYKAGIVEELVITLFAFLLQMFSNMYSQTTEKMNRCLNLDYKVIQTTAEFSLRLR